MSYKCAVDNDITKQNQKILYYAYYYFFCWLFHVLYSHRRDCVLLKIISDNDEGYRGAAFCASGTPPCWLPLRRCVLIYRALSALKYIKGKAIQKALISMATPK